MAEQISTGGSATFTLDSDDSFSVTGSASVYATGPSTSVATANTGTSIYGPYRFGASVRIIAAEAIEYTITRGTSAGPNLTTQRSATTGLAELDDPSLAALSHSGVAANPSAFGSTVVAFGDSMTAQHYFMSSPSAFAGSGNTVTVTSTSHGQAVGDPIRITGLTETEYNGDFTVTSRVDANNFTYTTETPVTTASPSGTGRCFFKKLLTNNGYLSYANAILGGRLNVVGIDGIPGETTLSMLARVPDVVALAPKHVVVLAGTNDLRSSARTPAEVLATLQTIYASFRAIPAVVYAMAVIPLGTSDTPPNGLTVAQVNGNIVAFNELLKNYCAANDGIVFVDSHAGIVSTAALTGIALAANLEDQIHPSPRGAYNMGAALAAQMSSRTKPGNTLPSSPADTVATFTASSNIIENPLFLAGTGGTVGAGVTEGSGAGTSIAQKWRVQLSGTATVAASLAARTVAADGDTLGNNQVITISTAANNDSATLDSQITLGSRLASGDQVYAECTVKVASLMSNVKRLNLNLNYTVGGVAYQSVMGYGTTSNNLPLDDGTYVFRTPVITLPGTPTAATLVAFVQAAGAGGPSVVSIGRAALRKVI